MEVFILMAIQAPTSIYINNYIIIIVDLDFGTILVGGIISSNY